MDGTNQVGPGAKRASVLWLLVLVGVLHVASLFNPFIIDDYIYLDTVHDLSWSGVPEVMDSATMDQDASGVWWTPYGDLPFYRPDLQREDPCGERSIGHGYRGF